jgi:hypothetical protein
VAAEKPITLAIMARSISLGMAAKAFRRRRKKTFAFAALQAVFDCRQCNEL